MGRIRWVWLSVEWRLVALSAATSARTPVQALPEREGPQRGLRVGRALRHAVLEEERPLALPVLWLVQQVAVLPVDI